MSMAVGADGFGLISRDELVNGDLKVAHCMNVFGTSCVRYRWQHETPE